MSERFARRDARDPLDRVALGFALFCSLVGACKSRAAFPLRAEPRNTATRSEPKVASDQVPSPDDGESPPWGIVEDSERTRSGVSVVGSVETLRVQVEWCMVNGRHFCGRY